MYLRKFNYLRILFIISLLASIVGPGVVLTSHADGPTVVINELMWMGSSVSSADEWIELRNLTDQPIDLSNWQLTKKSSGVEVAMLTIPAGKSIPAQGFFLISNYAESNANSILGVVPDVVNTDVALSNSALQVKLYEASHAVLDAADDGAGNPLSGVFDSTSIQYASMERNIVPGDGTLAQNWHPANKGVGLKAGVVEFGTPAAANSNALPAAEAGPDQTGIVGQEINFDGSDSSDPEGQTLTYAWDFGDAATASEVTPKHVYTTVGVFTVTLMVGDGIDTASNTATATVSAAPPVEPTSSAPPPATTTANTTPPTTAVSCRGLELSELYPNPPGVDHDEFIELVNNGDEEVTTGMCSIAIGLKIYPLPVGQAVPMADFVLLKKPDIHFTLTNAGATLKLLDSDGTELDRTMYQTAPEGKSWVWVERGWQWTTMPTPGGQNVLTLENGKETTNAASTNLVTPSKITTKKSKTVKTENPPQAATIAQIQELDSGDKVIVRGVVTTLVGALGATMTFIQDNDAGVAVTVPNGEPSIAVGNEVEITGTVRLKQGRRYVAAQTHGVNVVSAMTDLTPENIATDDVSQEQADQLVHVKGLVALASGNRIEIDDGSGPVPIYIKSSTGIVRPKVKAGDTVDAIGIVNVSTSGVRVLPRSQEDIKVERVLGASTAVPVPTTTIPSSSSQQSVWYWIMAGLGGLGAAAKPAWRAWKARQSDAVS